MNEISLANEVTNLVIVSPADMTKATQVLSQANTALDAIKKQEDKVIKPLKLALKAKQDEFAPLKKQLTTLVAVIRSKMSDYQTQEMKKAQAEKEKIAARIKEGKGNLSLETGIAKIEAVDTPEASVATDAGMVSFMTVKKLQITDLALIPREYLVPDEVKIKAALKEGVVVAGAELIEVQVPKNYR